MHEILQIYWWCVVSLLGGILVFMLFVQGGQTLLFTLAKSESEKDLIVSSIGKKWELTFTTLVMFGGACFAAFPLFYATSFGGAYWAWMALLFCFIIQAVAYEYRKKPDNFLGAKTYEAFLFINGSLGTILLGIIAGYIVAYCFGMVDFSAIASAPWFRVPSFSAPKFELEAIIYMIPIAIAPAIEHIGDMLAISNVTKEDFLKNPGLKNTLLGDGLATSLAAAFGGPPNTTYSEVTGAVSLTKAYNPAIMTFAAITAIVLAFVGKLGAVLSTIPAPVIGGIMLLLFGIIASVGMETLIKNKVDLADPRNMIIVALIFIFAIGGMVLDLGAVKFSGIGLGAVTGIVLNLLLPKTKHYEGY